MHQYDTAKSGHYQATALVNKLSAEERKLHCGRGDRVLGHEIFSRSSLFELNLIVDVSQIMDTLLLDTSDLSLAVRVYIR
mmetsp:Transcript_18520/g.29963  ORF Transcript_18520/g.29963 Transcript_18520/m.29963 type:complete len:80 (+) Transcript_18520:201-440(+)